MSSPRSLPIALAVLALAGGIGAFAVLTSGDARAPRHAFPPAVRGAAERTLLQAGGGPAGSAAVALNRWRYRADPGDRGRREGWSDGRWTGRMVRVPYAPNAAPIAGPAGVRNMAGGVGWFARSVKAPAAGRYVIAFESAQHHASVYVDGHSLRDHAGAYEPFSARPLLRRGRHRIAVRVDWRDPLALAAQGYGRGWFNYGGLQRPVTLARLGPTELGALNVATRLHGGGGRRAIVSISVRVRNRAAGHRAVRVRGSLARGGDAWPLRFAAAHVAPGRSQTVRSAVVVDHPALWSPSAPQRYELRIEVPGEARLTRRIGLRELSWGASGLSLNGAPLVLRGAALPPDARGRGDALRPIDEQRIVDQLRRVGANATRSQLPLSESMLERLDAAGILVWQVIGPWESAGQHRSTTSAPQARDRALRTAEAQQPHPSLLAWTLTNELDGEGRPDQRRYVEQTAARLHAMDPTRPVAVDIWGSHLPSSPGGLYAGLDAIGVTDYVGWYSELDAGARGQAQVAAQRLAHLHALFADEPIVISELGAIGSPRPAPGAFGSRGFQARLLARRIRDLRGTPGLSGTIVWSLRDYALRPDFDGGSVLRLRPGLRVTPGINEKGLFDYAGRPKPALAAVRRAFRHG